MPMMEINYESRDILCALCLEPCGITYKIDEDTTKMMALLLLKLDNTGGSQSMMCYKCACNIRSCFKFKSDCLCLENNTVLQSNTKDDVKLDSSVTTGEFEYQDTASEHLTTPCRLCLKVENCKSYTLLDDKRNVNATILMHKYLPELGHHALELSSICATCRISLETFFTAMGNWSRLGRYTVESTVTINQNSDINVDFDLMPLCETKHKYKEECSELDDIFSESTEDKPKFNQDKLNLEPFSLMKPEEQEFAIKQEEVNFKMESNNYMERGDRTKDLCHVDNQKNNGVKRHITKNQHRPEFVQFECDKCDYKTKRKSNLNYHMKIHQDPSEVVHYKCDQCDLTTTHKSSLVRHMVTHQAPSEVVHYQCDKCNFKTKRKVNLGDHMMTHQDPSEIIHYQCDKCDYKTKFRNALTKHVTTHQNPRYHCDKCGYKAKWSSCLKKHMLIHQDVSQVVYYRCDKCDFKTIRKYTLRQHMTRHQDPSEVMHYHCEKCSYKTRWRYGFKVHLQKKHSPIPL